MLLERGDNKENTPPRKNAFPMQNYWIVKMKDDIGTAHLKIRMCLTIYCIALENLGSK